MAGLKELYMRDEAEVRNILSAECGKNSYFENFSPSQFVTLHEIVFNEKEDIVWEDEAEKKAEEKFVRFSRVRTSLDKSRTKNTKRKPTATKKKKKVNDSKRILNTTKKVKATKATPSNKLDELAQLETLRAYIQNLGGTLPSGWMVKISKRKGSDTAGLSYVNYISPDGDEENKKRYHSCVEVARALGLHP